MVFAGLAHVDIRKLGLSRLGDTVFGQLEGVVARVDDVVLAKADDTVLCDLGEVCHDLVVGEEVGEVLVDQLVAVAQLVVWRESTREEGLDVYEVNSPYYH